MYDAVAERYPQARSTPTLCWRPPGSAEVERRRTSGGGLYRRLAADCPEFAKLDAVPLRVGVGDAGDRQTPDDAAALFQRLHKEYPQSRYWADATCRLAQRAIDKKD